MANGYDYKKYAVLYVDDEEQSLKYFRRALEKDFRVLTAASAAAALEILEKEGGDVGVLVTDQRMPGQTGVDLLAIVRRSRPKIVRILTTAYADLDSTIEAVNTGAIYQYVTKPWSLRDLRGLLLRAMEFFLIQRERDLLLREKLSVLQRILLTDRVRSLTVLAGGLAHHIRNSMTALKAFLELAPVNTEDIHAVSDLRDNLRSLAVQESQRILKMVQDVTDTTVAPRPVFDSVLPLSDLLSRGLDEALQETGAPRETVRLETDPSLPPLKADASLLQRLFALLLLRMIRHDGSDHTITVRAVEEIPIWGTAGVRVLISSDGPAWSDELVSSFFTLFAPAPDDPKALGVDLLSAFFIAYHHGGDVVVHRDRPEGPGFEVRLPIDPEAVDRPSLEDSSMEKLFTRFEALDGT
jgi:two-component system probable response regulator PhcQ